MRAMDELSGGATTRRLPAPAGPRIPTGQVPVELPPGPLPGPEPVRPYLPAAPAKASGPVTGQVASIVVVTDPANTPPATATKQRSRVRIVLMAALIIAIAAATVVFLSPS